MKDYLEIANNNLLYILAAIVILFVLVQSSVFLFIAWKRGIELGISKGKMMAAIKSSAIFSIVPSIPIVVSLIAIAPILGVPFSWLRLSIIGSNSYELIAAGMGAQSMGVEGLGGEGYTPQVFGNSMLIMSIGIIWGLICCVFILKRYQKRMNHMQQKDSTWAEILINALFFGMLSVLLGEPLAVRGISLYVLLSSAGIMVLMTYISKKLKLRWLNDFALSFSMIGGMILAIVYAGIL
jgi:hypothetical protein